MTPPNLVLSCPYRLPQRSSCSTKSTRATPIAPIRSIPKLRPIWCVRLFVCLAHEFDTLNLLVLVGLLSQMTVHSFTLVSVHVLVMGAQRIVPYWLMRTCKWKLLDARAQIIIECAARRCYGCVFRLATPQSTVAGTESIAVTTWDLYRNALNG